MVYELAVSDSGVGTDPALPAVVLLHAFPCDRSMWQAQYAALVEHGFRVLAPDFPGFGASPLAPVEPDLAFAAQAVFDLLDDRAVGSAAVVGLSLGGYLAMEMLRQQPGRVTRLVLVDTKAGVDSVAAQEKRYQVADAVAVQGSSEPIMAMLPKLVGPTTQAERPEVVAHVEGFIRKAKPDAITWAQRAMAARPDSAATLAQFSDPALLIWGDQDDLSLATDQKYMAQALPECQQARIPDSGHLSALECPDAVSSALITFLRES